MINFELDNTKTGLDVFLDAEGISELIGYLKFIQEKKDHYHLIAGNELSEKSINKMNTSITLVNLFYVKE